MSLRLRLLIAVGLISIGALVVADFATYSALRSYLYNQIDQTLVLHRLPFEIDNSTGEVRCPGPGNNGFVFGGEPPGGLNGASGYGAPNALVFAFVEIRSANGQVVNGLQCPSYIDGQPYSPALHSRITGLAPQSDGSKASYFTASAAQPNGPAFRVRVSNGIGSLQLPGGDQLVIAEPIASQTNILHTLFLTEVGVTAAAVLIALVGGWWLVRLGL